MKILLFLYIMEKERGEENGGKDQQNLMMMKKRKMKTNNTEGRTTRDINWFNHISFKLILFSYRTY